MFTQVFGFSGVLAVDEVSVSSAMFEWRILKKFLQNLKGEKTKYCRGQGSGMATNDAVNL
jgi:hypothetical protein